jgi:hypothetical protein
MLQQKTGNRWRSAVSQRALFHDGISRRVVVMERDSDRAGEVAGRRTGPRTSVALGDDRAGRAFDRADVGRPTGS